MNEPLKPNEYQCAVCNGIFKKGTTDEAAKEEFTNSFPGLDMDDSEFVCEVCFNAIFSDLDDRLP